MTKATKHHRDNGRSSKQGHAACFLIIFPGPKEGLIGTSARMGQPLRVTDCCMGAIFGVNHSNSREVICHGQLAFCT